MDVLKRHRQQSPLWHLVLLSVALTQITTRALWPQSSAEYEVKAAFLYKFASFVEWPEALEREPLGICVVGRDPFGIALERVVEGKTIGGREFAILRLRTWRAGAHCQIVFIAASEMGRLHLVLGQLQQDGILTVGDVPGFCESGGAINLNVVDSRVKLEINVDTTARSGLQVSSKLLSLARIVHDTVMAGGMRE